MLLLKGRIVVALWAEGLRLTPVHVIDDQLEVIDWACELCIWLDGPTLGKGIGNLTVLAVQPLRAGVDVAQVAGTVTTP